MTACSAIATISNNRYIEISDNDKEVFGALYLKDSRFHIP